MENASCTHSLSLHTHLVVGWAVLNGSDADALVSTDWSAGLASPTVRLGSSMVPYSCTSPSPSPLELV